MLQSAEYLSWKQPTVGQTSAKCRPHLILESSATKEAVPAINDLKSLLQQVSFLVYASHNWFRLFPPHDLFSPY